MIAIPFVCSTMESVPFIHQTFDGSSFRLVEGRNFDVVENVALIVSLSKRRPLSSNTATKLEIFYCPRESG